MDTQLKDRFEEKYTVTGYSLCPDHQQQFQDGYIHLVEIEEEEGEEETRGLFDVSRTGRVFSLRRSKWNTVFNSELPDEELPFVFISSSAGNVLEGLKDASETN